MVAIFLLFLQSEPACSMVAAAAKKRNIGDKSFCLVDAGHSRCASPDPATLGHSSAQATVPSTTCKQTLLLHAQKLATKRSGVRNWE